ncbi:MAG: hypothetical protein Q9213_007544 [Squamulea squamosa]
MSTRHAGSSHWSSIIRNCCLLGSAIQRPGQPGRSITSAHATAQYRTYRKQGSCAWVAAELQSSSRLQTFDTHDGSRFSTADTAIVPSFRDRQSREYRNWVVRSDKRGRVATRRLPFCPKRRRDLIIPWLHRRTPLDKRLGRVNQQDATKLSARWRLIRTRYLASNPTELASSQPRVQTRIKRLLSLRRQLPSSDRQNSDAEQKDRRARTVFASLALWNQTHNTSGKNVDLDEVSLQWTQRFALIYNGETEQVPSSVVPVSLLLEILGGDTDYVTQSWERVVTGLPLHKGRLLWQEVMLWALQHQIGKAMTFLDVTISDSSMPALRHAAEDALKHIVSIFLQGQVANSGTIKTIHRLLCVFAKASTLQNGCTYSISQKIVYLVMRHSDNHQAQALYEVLLNARMDIHPHSLTHFMDRFTRMGRPDLAMHVLRRIAAAGANVSHDRVQYSCITLLRTRFDDVEWYKIQSYMVTEMLELGIRPGMPMLNAMILNAVEACDYQTAQAMSETARIHGIRRNAITYSILLKGALQNLDDCLVERIMHMAEEDGALPRNNELVFSLIVTMLQIARLNDTNVVTSAHRYKTILRIYTRYCDVQPLQELGIYLDIDKSTGTAEYLSEPSPKLLSIMIVSYIRLTGQPDRLLALYHRYQYYVNQNHHLIAPTAETDHLANAFLLGLGRHTKTFRECPVILRNMLEPSAKTTFNVAQPTVKTWSIAARSYFFHGQRAAGDKVIEMMRARGLAPNFVTWNTIISGYASIQDATAVVNAMKGMESAGFEANSYTLKALARIKDRNQLLEALRKVAANDDKAWMQAQSGHDSYRSPAEAPSDEGNEIVQMQIQAPTVDTQAADSSKTIRSTEQRTYNQASSSQSDELSRLDRFRRTVNEQRHRTARWSNSDADGDFLENLGDRFKRLNLS